MSRAVKFGGWDVGGERVGCSRSATFGLAVLETEFCNEARLWDGTQKKIGPLK